MSYFVREHIPEHSDEMDIIVQRCMETVLETIPEFQGKTELAQQVFSNFTFEQMKGMISGNVGHPNHQILVSEDKHTKEVVGHFIFSIKQDSEHQMYGFCYSCYIHPKHRRRGIAQRLLTEAESWWRERGAMYAVASTHTTNIKLQNLFLKNGYQLIEPNQHGKLKMYGLRKEL